ncbi:MAG: hypothetical protein K2P84_11535 [Undibacterium sp.]|nr:hypothetical protein [Undibacterium sp.]
MDSASINHEIILQALLNRDGSCRDFNFAERLSRQACVNIIALIKRDWELTEGHNSDGKLISLESVESYLDHDTGAVHLIWTSHTKCPPHLQIYISFEASEYFCELTFFPGDLYVPYFDLSEFLNFLNRLVTVSGSKEYYLRYEDASWRHGEETLKASVIFSHSSFKLSP